MPAPIMTRQTWIVALDLVRHLISGGMTRGESIDQVSSALDAALTIPDTLPEDLQALLEAADGPAIRAILALALDVYDRRQARHAREGYSEAVKDRLDRVTKSAADKARTDGQAG